MKYLLILISVTLKKEEVDILLKDYDKTKKLVYKIKMSRNK